MRIAGIAVLAIVAGACRAIPPGQAPATIAVTTRFGPVIGPEVISGRVVDRAILLLAGGFDLVSIDLAARRAERRPLTLAPGEACWGLARLDNGELWTLKGRATLARVERSGRIAAEIPLAAPHFGVFAAGNRLAYQEAIFTAPGPALHTGTPDGTARAPWSALTTRPFARLARASATALNMVSCGSTASPEVPCWFPDEAAVSLIDAAGHTRRVALPGLTTVSPESLLTSDNPARPVRDAYVDRAGGLWVLSSGSLSAETSHIGGWIIARYSRDGAALGLSRLSEPARLILAAETSRVTLLLSSGSVGEITPW
jgi:hypothetical protein